jgi:hypothetical protein
LLDAYARSSTACGSPVAAGPGVLDAGLPDEQAAGGVLAVERLHQAADLVAVPDVAAPGLGQGHAAQVDRLDPIEAFVDDNSAFIHEPGGLFQRARSLCIS